MLALGIPLPHRNLRRPLFGWVWIFSGSTHYHWWGYTASVSNTTQCNALEHITEISHLWVASVSKRVFVWNYWYGNVFCLHFISMQIKLIFIWKVLHEDSLWNRGTRQLGNVTWHMCQSQIPEVIIVHLLFWGIELCTCCFQEAPSCVWEKCHFTQTGELIALSSRK